ncbi:MAG: histidine kinase [Chitinophagaceae bacterium]|nr:histidine kinase [Chitinophagaceae bacterium]
MNTQAEWIADFMTVFFPFCPGTAHHFSGWVLILFLYHYVKGVRREEQLRTAYQFKMNELEAKALRAQMNPHFIFNCLNSIKSLIQQNENEKSVTYLTTFSKLIRTLLNNADKKEISLYDEIETCKLYLQLEAMRFDTKFSYVVNVDKAIDLKSIQVPALIIQPFIENAIWHGIMPRNSTGHVSLNVIRKNGSIQVAIDDDGIGREASQQIKPNSNLAHQSKGVNLTKSRLELNNLLQQRQSQLEVIDKKDDKGLATGTTVIINIKEELS